MEPDRPNFLLSRIQTEKQSVSAKLLWRIVDKEEEEESVQGETRELKKDGHLNPLF